MKLVTSTGRSVGHPELEAAVEHEDWFCAELHDLIESMGESILLGTRFCESDDYAVGWMPIRVAQRHSGNLGFDEPDFRSMPIRWVPRLDRCFEHFRVHMRLLAAIGLADKPSFTTADQAAVVGRDFFDADAWNLRREPPAQGRDTGWVFTPAQPLLDYDADPHGTLLFQSLYETALQRPEIVPFMCLPVGTEVRIATGGGITISMDGEIVVSGNDMTVRDLLPRRVD